MSAYIREITKVLIYKGSPFFDTRVAHKMFEENKQLMNDRGGFEKLLENSLFFNVYDKGCFIGILFAFEEEGKTWIGGAAHRKCHKACINAVQEVASMFDKVYARTPHKTAAFCLRRAGFKFVHKQKDLMIFKFKKGALQNISQPK